jgi:hypothetical protein
MTAGWAARQEELLHDCVVSPHVFEHIVGHLCDFIVPYQHCLETEAEKRNMHLYLAGLLSHLPRRNAEEIVTFVDVDRLVMHHFIGTGAGTIVPWSRCWLFFFGNFFELFGLNEKSYKFNKLCSSGAGCGV